MIDSQFLETDLNCNNVFTGRPLRISGSTSLGRDNEREALLMLLIRVLVGAFLGFPITW